MPIHVGIICERCGKVHFIATSKRIEMLPYAVSDDVFSRGYAERNEYELVQKT